MAIDEASPIISVVRLPGLENGPFVHLLRLDLLHPAISGNKWFKLKYNLQAAQNQSCTALLSFGGARSNHLHALAFAGYQIGIPSIGYVRGEMLQNPTLADCIAWGMQVHSVSRAAYRQKAESEFLRDILQAHPGAYLIPEGGSNEEGIQGCREILHASLQSRYDLIACAVGTGTTFAGIAQTLGPEQHILGFTAMKQGEYLNDTLKPLIPHTRWSLATEFHGGGFGKMNTELRDFMQQFRDLNHIELDRVYTAKMMLGLQYRLQQQRISSGLRILAIHTGGLQGNRP